MRRLVRLALRLAVAALLLGGVLVGGTVLYYSVWPMQLELSFDSATDAHNAARRDFWAALPPGDCLSRAQIIAAADARGWEWRDEPEFAWCHWPTGLSDWLRVTVSPALTFSTDDENAAFFGFDAMACSRDWSYASGPGSTCP